ncbi:MAG: FAD-dependent thymidylate synthase [Proteobacteria bacterium]|nr:FAD-dependent thymidylate synthase [Pseudomonadota bacterium]
MTEPDVEAPERVARPAVAELDEILGLPLRVLDDGFVRVVDYLGSDAAIVQAARVSYGAGTRQLQEDRGLLRYLMRHRHSTPFEMCELKLHVRVPMDCWRQWIRHRTANVNEYSTRYSVAIDAMYHTSADNWRLQANHNRQGSAGVLDAAAGETLSRRELELQQQAREVYQERLAHGVARELARKDLPLSTYTEAYWKIDLHNLLHFLALRLDGHAQQEIRSYAQTIGHEIVRRWCPLTWEAFVDYRLHRLELTRRDLEVVRAFHAGGKAAAIVRAQEVELLPPAGTTSYPRNRERDELEQKLTLLGLPVPWRE